MASQAWYYQAMGTAVGPISPPELKKLVATRAVEPITLVRLGEQGKWVEAGRVNGLFDGAAAVDATDRHKHSNIDDVLVAEQVAPPERPKPAGASPSPAAKSRAGRGPLACPYCEAAVADDVRHAGQAVTCPRCHGAFSAPGGKPKRGEQVARSMALAVVGLMLAAAIVLIVRGPSYPQALLLYHAERDELDRRARDTVSIEADWNRQIAKLDDDIEELHSIHLERVRLVGYKHEPEDEAEIEKLQKEYDERMAPVYAAREEMTKDRDADVAEFEKTVDRQRARVNRAAAVRERAEQWQWR